MGYDSQGQVCLCACGDVAGVVGRDAPGAVGVLLQEQPLAVLAAFAGVDVLVENIKKEDVLAGHGHVRLELAAPVAVGEDLPGVVGCFGQGCPGLGFEGLAGFCSCHGCRSGHRSRQGCHGQ